MRKALLMVLAGIFLLCGSVQAAQSVRITDDDGVTIDGRLWETYSIDNKANDWTETNISTAVITVNNHKILGFQVLPIGDTDGQGSEVIAALHDTTSIAGELVSSLKMIDELEADAATYSAYRWWGNARKIQNQLTVMQGPWTRVIIYYTE